MDKVALHFAACYGWPKASHLSDVIAEQKQHVVNEGAKEAEETS
jgi:4-carboxymuconolactone decarboxylase